MTVFAHRGDSGPHPEMTRAAFASAIDIARTRGVAIGLECDVHFTADGQLGCLHDASLARTGRDADGSPVTTTMDQLTVAELKQLDFGSWRTDLSEVRELTADEREFMTLADLLDMVAAARAEGVEVGVAIETKHPVSRDEEVEAAVAEQLKQRGWTGPDSGIRMISFSADGVARMDALLPDLPQTFIFSREEVWQTIKNGSLVVKDGHAFGISGALIRKDPQIVDDCHALGREFHVWTINEIDDIKAVRDVGVDAITSDHPARVFDVLSD